jgi:hypothetical protein
LEKVLVSYVGGTDDQDEWIPISKVPFLVLCVYVRFARGVEPLVCARGVEPLTLWRMRTDSSASGRCGGEACLKETRWGRQNSADGG